MTASPQALAVIPARGGSKRLPGKNTHPFHGKPALAWTIGAALESRIFQQVVVSTDDPQIATLAREHGAEVPFLRTPELADDHTHVSLVTLDALQRLDPEGCRFGAVAQLMPNCPLRTAGDIRDSFRQFTETGAGAQISVTSYGWLNPWWALTRDATQRLAPLFAERHAQRSQDMPALFCPTGAVWWIQPEVLRREKTFHVANRTGWTIPWRHAVDIDTIEDLEMAEFFYQAKEPSPGIL